VDESAAEDYDEFDHLQRYAELAGLEWSGRPEVERDALVLGSGEELSYLRWGSASPELVLLHGGGQNAHTWDTLLIILRRPAVAFDLPGHGHSYWREDHNYWSVANAQAIAEAYVALGLTPRVVIGHSLGGLTTIRMAATSPELVPRAVILDVTPSVHESRRKREGKELDWPTERPMFDTFDALVDSIAERFSKRPRESLAIGARHNSRRLEDGRWEWRHDVLCKTDMLEYWADVAAMRCPILLVRGGESELVPEEDRLEFERLQPSSRHALIPSAGHNVASDAPVELAALVEEFMFH
jgi:pimeloyl-ACP methyl ester carboxylesterase